MKSFLLRKESFGGTLQSSRNGKRIYLDREEFRQIERSKRVSGTIAKEIGHGGNVRIITPKFLPPRNFSFPDTIYYEVTRRCNLRCKQCFNYSGRELEKELKPQEQLRLIERLALAGAQEIRFTGGEPMRHPDIYGLIRKTKQLGLRASIGTNATLITEDAARKLAGAGLDGAVVSIDGNQEMHDLIRGSGNFLRALAGIKNLQKAGIGTRINTTAMKDNLSSIPELADFFHQQKLKMYVKRLMPTGRASINWSKKALTKDDYRWLEEKMQKLLKDPDGLIYGHYLRPKKYESRIELPFVRRKCTVGQRAISIEPDGRIGLCGFLQQDKVAFNVQTAELDEIWKKITAIDPIQALGMDKALKKYNKKAEMETDCYALAIGAMR